MGLGFDPQEQALDEVRHSQIYAMNDGEPVALRANQFGEVDVSLEMESVRIEGVDDDGNVHEVNVEQMASAIDSASAIGFVTYPSRALSSVGQDAVVITTRARLSAVTSLESRGTSRIDLQDPGAPISGGNAVSAALSAVDSFTLYLSAASAVDVTVELSPDLGANPYEIDESPIPLASAGDVDVTKLSYDANWIRLEGSKNTNVRAQIFQIT